MHRLMGILFALFITIGTVEGARAGSGLATGVQLFERGDHDAARKAFEAVAGADPENFEAAYYLGRIALRKEDFDDAVRWLEKATAGVPLRSDYHWWLGRAYGEKALRASVLKKPFLAKSIKKEFETAVALNPENLEARGDLLQFYLLAPGIMGGSVEKAKEQATEILKRDPAQGHRQMGRVYESQKEFDRAEQEYLAAVGVDPNDKNSCYTLGYFYQARERFDRAFEVFEALVKADAAEWPAYYQIGRTAVLSGMNLDRAEQCFRTYLEKAPKDANPAPVWAHYRLGMLYEKKGNKDLARRAYAAALALQPDHKETQAALKKLS